MNRRPLEAAVRSGIARPAGTAATDTDAIDSAPDARRAHATRGNRSTRRPHRFYMVMGVIAILVAAAGFGGSFGAMVSGRKTFTLLVHIHAAVFFGWLVLYLVQAGLVAAGRETIFQRLAAFTKPPTKEELDKAHEGTGVTILGDPLRVD